MTIKELISELKKYDENMNVALVNLDDDTNESNVILSGDHLAKIEIFDEHRNKYTGICFLGICHKNQEI